MKKIAYVLLLLFSNQALFSCIYITNSPNINPNISNLQSNNQGNANANSQSASLKPSDNNSSTTPIPSSSTIPVFSQSPTTPIPTVTQNGFSTPTPLPTPTELITPTPIVTPTVTSRPVITSTSTPISTVTPIPTTNPIVSVNPTSGQNDTIFTFTGSGFTPNGTATIYYSSSNNSNPSTSLQPIDSNGNYIFSLNVNDINGIYYYYAKDNFSGKQTAQITYNLFTSQPTSNIISLGKPVSLYTNGAEDFKDSDGNIINQINNFNLIVDGKLSNKIEVGYTNINDNQEMILNLTIDLQETYKITKIRYNMGNVQRAETWGADIMTTPFGNISPVKGSTFSGAWTEQTGNYTSSKVNILLKKTKVNYATDWLAIGEIEVYGYK